MKLKTASFGVQDYQEESVLHLPEGMLGFSRLRRFILIEEQDIHPFRWLQCLDDPELAFPVVDPHFLVADYAASIPRRELQKLQVNSFSDVVTLVVAIIPEDGRRASVNLKAPLLINHRNMTGRQVILTESSYSVRTPVIEERELCLQTS